MNSAMRILIGPAIVAGLAIGCASGRSGEAEVAAEAQTQEAPAPSTTPAAASTQQPGGAPAVKVDQDGSKPATPDTQKADPPSGQSKAPKKEEPPAREQGAFTDDAFPPTVSDVEYHEGAWFKNDCLRCHETGVGIAPVVKHESMLSDAQRAILKTAKCRSCHVFVPGSKPRVTEKQHDERFAEFAFPPMIPASPSHQGAWNRADCMLCHEDGLKGAPIAEHRSMLSEAQRKILRTAKCRSCHVQVRAHEQPPTKRSR